MTNRYLNTDLDIASRSDLAALATAFEEHGLVTLHVARGEDSHWHGRFATSAQFGNPEDTIAAMLDVIEALDAPSRAGWQACTAREFNIGYACGSAVLFNNRLGQPLLSRIARAGADVGITLYGSD